uniref:AAA family ATPase n=1 Tax=Aureimonas sp. SK2 TaxID=3015992 RepID=UPI0024453611
LLSVMSDQTVILCTDVPPPQLPAVLRTLTDIQVIIDPLDAGAMTGMLRRRFTGWDGVWPADCDPARLSPALIDVAMTRSADAERAISVLTRLHQTPTLGMQRSSTPRVAPFATLDGYGEAKSWGLQLAADIASYKAGNLPWSDVDDGALLAGPPGTGKTTFVQSLAEYIGCSFTATSYADWQSSGSGHLGDVTKKIAKIFSEAAEETPSIVFIDEIDTLPTRSGNAASQDWWNAIVNALLEQVDGACRPDGVVVIAACNAPQRLDPALVRSGRLDRTFHIALPDESALKSIFSSYLNDLVSDADISTVATALAGTISGADVARIARDTRKRARHERRPVVGADLMAAAFPPDRRPQAMQWRVAIHEAGHAVASMAMGNLPSSISIMATASTEGHVRFSTSIGDGTLDDVMRSLVPVLAGRAAELSILGAASAGAGGGLQSDLGVATSMLAALDGLAGLGTRLRISESADGAFVETQLRRLHAEATFLVWLHRAAIIDLATIVMTARVLGEDALKRFAAEHGYAPNAVEPIDNDNMGELA